MSLLLSVVFGYVLGDIFVIHGKRSYGFADIIPDVRSYGSLDIIFLNQFVTNGEH